MENIEIPKKRINLSTMLPATFIPRANLTDRESEIATHTVLRGKMLQTTDAFMRARIATRETFTFTTGAGVTTHTLTLVRNIVRNLAIPLQRENVIVVRRSPTPVVEWTTFTVTMPRTVALTGLVAATTYTIEVIYLHGYGSLSIHAVYGDGQATDLLFSKSIEMINSTDLANIRTAFAIDNPDVFIPEDARIEIRANSTAPIILYGATETAFSSPFARQSFVEIPVYTYDLEHFDPGMKEWAKRQIAGLVH